MSTDKRKIEELLKAYKEKINTAAYKEGAANRKKVALLAAVAAFSAEQKQNLTRNASSPWMGSVVHREPRAPTNGTRVSTKTGERGTRGAKGY